MRTKALAAGPGQVQSVTTLYLQSQSLSMPVVREIGPSTIRRVKPTRIYSIWQKVQTAGYQNRNLAQGPCIKQGKPALDIIYRCSLMLIEKALPRTNYSSLMLEVFLKTSLQCL